MNKKSMWFIRTFRILLLIGMIIGLLAIARYPFKYNNLSVSIESAERNISLDIPKEELNQNNYFAIILKDQSELSIKRIRFYGKFKSISLMELTTQQLMYSLLSNGSTDFTVDSEGKFITAKANTNGGITLIFNQTTSEDIDNLSKTHLLDRIIYGLYWIVICWILYLITMMMKEKLDNSDNHGPIYEIKKCFRDIINYWEYTNYAAKADLKAEVANSYLNRLWWLLEPFFSMLVYIIVFGQIMGRSTENYPSFVFSSLLMWAFFNRSITYSVKLVRINRDIVTKVYVPKFILLICNMILNFYKLIFSLIVLIPMMIIFKIHISATILWLIPTYSVMILFTFGLGMILLHFGVYVDDLSYAVGILISMLMFLSGIFYDVMTTLPAPLNTILTCLNPISLFVSTMRNALLYNRILNVPLIIVWGMISIIICYIGIHIVYKNENAYVKMV